MFTCCCLGYGVSAATFRDGDENGKKPPISNICAVAVKLFSRSLDDETE